MNKKNAVFLVFLLTFFLDYSLQAQMKASLARHIFNNHDGRFTLGNKDKRMMYGFPIPTSTSHFILKVDTMFLSNNPQFQGRPHMIYLKGRSTETGTKTKTVETEYTYGKFRIVQHLIPADKNLKEIVNGSPAQFYLVQYEFVNLSPKAVKAGLLVLFDTMIDDNDFCKMKVDGGRMDVCAVYPKLRIPPSVTIYHDVEHPDDQLGEFRPTTDVGDVPDTMYIGNWPVLHEVVWNSVPQKGKYSDSGILVKWNETTVSPQATLKHASAYGIPKEHPGDLRILLQAPDLQSYTRTIYFGPGKWDLDMNGTMVVEDVMRSNKDIKGVVIHGFSDAVGSDENAMDLSVKRIATIAKIFEKYGVATVPKSHGNLLADFSETSVKEGNAWDRKVVIEVYY